MASKETVIASAREVLRVLEGLPAGCRVLDAHMGGDFLGSWIHLASGIREAAGERALMDAPEYTPDFGRLSYRDGKVMVQEMYRREETT